VEQEATAGLRLTKDEADVMAELSEGPLRVKPRRTQIEHSSSGLPPTTDIARLLRCSAGTLAIREYLVARNIGKLSPTRHSAKSQTVARSRGLACGRLRRHSATAKQYCSSSSIVARHFGRELGTPKPAIFALEAATNVRSSSLFDPMMRRSCASTSTRWATARR
jgi:hypothetical protein